MQTKFLSQNVQNSTIISKSIVRDRIINIKLLSFQEYVSFWLLLDALSQLMPLRLKKKKLRMFQEKTNVCLSIDVFFTLHFTYLLLELRASIGLLDFCLDWKELENFQCSKCWTIFWDCSDRKFNAWDWCFYRSVSTLYLLYNHENNHFKSLYSFDIHLEVWHCFWTQHFFSCSITNFSSKYAKNKLNSNFNDSFMITSKHDVLQ